MKFFTSLLPFLFLLTINTFVFSQKDGERRKEQIQADKIAFISNDLQLTTEEAQVFWPIYNVYEARIHSIRKERKKYHYELKNSIDTSDERAYELMELIFNTEKKESDIRLEYLAEFSEVLGKKKAAQLYLAEHMFKRELLRKLRDKDIPQPPKERH